MENELEVHHHSQLINSHKISIDDGQFQKSNNSKVTVVRIKLPECQEKRRHTCLMFQFDKHNLIRKMSENIYCQLSLKDEAQATENEDSSSQEDSEEEIFTGSRKYSLSSQKIKKLGRKLTENSSQFSQNKQCNTETNDYANLANSFPSKISGKQIINQNTELAMNLTSSCQDTVFEALFNKYYCDISENSNMNFENYVVSNLTIISYLDKKLQQYLQYPTLNKEDIDKMNSLDRTKKLLFLDLDETLIHSDIQHEFDNHDAEISFAVDESECKVNMFLRPFTYKFLKFAKEKFNIILFTAGIKEYADPIIKYIDPLDEYFDMRLYRNSCIEFNNIFIKDLSILRTFGLKDMIIIDNCIFSFAINLRNGVLIPSYLNDREDRELLNVIDYLESRLIDVSDIRIANESFYGFELIKNCMYEKLEKEGIV